MSKRILSKKDVGRTILFLEGSLRRALEASAKARPMTMSAWIREAIKEKLEREGGNERRAT